MKKSILIQSFLIILFSLLTISISAQNKQSKVGAPYFLVQSNGGDTDQLPLKRTSAEVNIAGVIANVAIQQVYENQGKTPLEAIYVFPGSTNAAIYAMEMKVGERTIVAQIEERNKARKKYTKAKSEGKRVSLLEQERPNVFQMQVANILPGDRIEVTLKYTELLVPTEGVYSFVYPTVVGPRYSTNEASSDNDADQFLSSPYSKAKVKPTYEFDMNIYLNAGMPLQNVVCKSHLVRLQFPDMNSAKIGLAKSDKDRGNKDFILNYQLAGGKINSGLMLYEGEHENFFTMVVQPPKKVTTAHIPPREYIFIVDISGSMHGFPLDISKKLMRNLIANLRPYDQFNVMLFAGSSFILAEESMNATEENINAAIKMIENQSGGGGTNMYDAVQNALAIPRCVADLSRSFVIVTDGYVHVETKLFELIRNNLNQANFFSFGIGSSVNRLLMEGIANVGRGEAFILTKPNEANEEANKFRQYIQSPVLTQIESTFEGFDVYDVEPVSIPDVLAERPVIIYGKYKGKAKGKIKLKGYSGEGPYYTNFNVEEVLPDTKNEALKYLWARETIKQLGDFHEVSRESKLKAKITSLGLKYNLMTAFTSFLAIDNVKTMAEGLTTVKQALPMPEGVSNFAVGFDLSISGISRKSKTHTHKKTMKAVSELQHKRIVDKVQSKIDELLIVFNNRFKLLKKITIKLSVDQSGKITKAKVMNYRLNEEFKEFVEDSLLDFQVINSAFIHARTIEVEVDLTNKIPLASIDEI